MSRPAASGPADRSRATYLYLAHVRVRHHELDTLGHVNNAAYLHYLEQAAIDHAAAAGFGEQRLRALGGLFIARRHEVDYRRPAFAGDWLCVMTWAVAITGARAVRAYEVARLGAEGLVSAPPRDGLVAPEAAPPTDDLIVRARTEWAFVDVHSGRPRRIPAELIRAFVRHDAPDGLPS